MEPPPRRLYSHEDPYKTLEISKNASPSDIKAAYKRLALKYHPDKNYNDPNSEANSAKFVEINWAYSVLSCPKKRKIYDSLGLVGIHTLEQSGDEYLDVLYWASGRWFKCLFLSLCCVTCNFCCLCCCCCCNCCCGQCGPDLSEPTSREDLNVNT